MLLMVIKNLYANFGGLHKKSLQREVENYQEQKRKLWKPLKNFSQQENVRTRLILSTYGHLQFFQRM